MSTSGGSGDEEDAVEDYRSSLEDLTFNSKPLINVLTMLAEENIILGDAIVKTIKERIEKVNPLMKMASLYLLDSILKNVGKEYRNFISHYIEDIFTHVFKEGDEKVKVALFKLRHTWTQYFSPKLLYDLDTKVHKMDPNWPVPSQPPPSPTIHVNPKFLKPTDDPKKKGDLRETLKSQEERLQEEERRIQEQLKKLQEAKEQIEKKRQEKSHMRHEGMNRDQQVERQKLLEEQKKTISMLEREAGKLPVHKENSSADLPKDKLFLNKGKPLDPRLTRGEVDAPTPRPLDKQRPSNQVIAPDTQKDTLKSRLTASIKENKNISREDTSSTTSSLPTESGERDRSHKVTQSPVINVSRDPRERKVYSQPVGHGRIHSRKADKQEQTMKEERMQPVVPVFKADAKEPDCRRNERNIKNPVVDSRRDPERRKFVKDKQNPSFPVENNDVEMNARESLPGEIDRKGSRERLTRENLHKGPLNARSDFAARQNGNRCRDPRRERQTAPRSASRREEIRHGHDEMMLTEMEVDTTRRDNVEMDWKRPVDGRMDNIDNAQMLRTSDEGTFGISIDRGQRERSILRGKENDEEQVPTGTVGYGFDGPPFKKMRGRENLGRGGLRGHYVEEEPNYGERINDYGFDETRVMHGRHPKRRLSAHERRINKMKAREDRRKMVPKETELPPELRMEHHGNLMEQVEIRLKAGEMSEQEHNNLVSQLELLYRIQRNRRDVSEIEKKTKLLKEHRERTQLQELAKSIERRDMAGDSFRPVDEERGEINIFHADVDRDTRRENFERNPPRIDEPPPHFFRPLVNEDMMPLEPHQYNSNRPFEEHREHRERATFHNVRNDHWKEPVSQFYPEPFSGDRHFGPAPPIFRPEPGFHGQDHWRNRTPPRYSEPTESNIHEDMIRWSSSLDESLLPDVQRRVEQRFPDIIQSVSGGRQWEMKHLEGRNQLRPTQDINQVADHGTRQVIAERGTFTGEFEGSNPQWNNGRERFSHMDFRRPPSPVRRQENLETREAPTGIPNPHSDPAAVAQDSKPIDSQRESAATLITGKTEEQGPGSLLATLLGKAHHSSQETESSQSSSGSSFVGVTELFNKLVNSGIISLHKEAEASRTETPPPELPTEEETIPEIKISLDSLRQRHTSIINQLYKGTQCASCGLRFPDEAKEQYGEHLDWHFKQNRRQKDNSKVGSRAWYPSSESWTSYDGALDAAGEAPQPTFEDNDVKFEKDAEEEYTCAVEQVEDDDICDVCCELFEQFWDEDLEEWRYRGAVRVNGRTYHFSCYKDSGAVTLETDEEEELRQSDQSNPDLKYSAVEEGKNKDDLSDRCIGDTEKLSISSPRIPEDMKIKVEEETVSDEPMLKSPLVKDEKFSLPLIKQENDAPVEDKKTELSNVVLSNEIVNAVKSETLEDEKMKSEDNLR